MKTHKLLLVIDMQNDFISGSLGSEDAQRIVPEVSRILREEAFDQIWITLDTHGVDYFRTMEGQKLPVVHCQEGEEGWQLAPEIQAALAGKTYPIYTKNTFGSVALCQDIRTMVADHESEYEVTFVGLCTDICVVANAITLRSFCPNLPIVVRSAATAGVTPERYQAALDTMAACQIEIQ